MKKNLKVLLLLVLVAAASCSFTTREFDNPDKDKLLVDLITYVLEQGHYDPKDMDDAFSEGVYDSFIDTMDPLKRYFHVSDIEDFEVYKHQIDDQLINKELTFFNLVYDRYVQRQKEAEGIYINVLSEPFDYTKNETINVDYEEMGYVSSKSELNERWRAQLKFSSISNYYDLMTEQSDNEADTDKEPMSEAEMEEASRKSTRTSLSDYFDFTKDLERKDYFASFLNSVVAEFDPHTNYFAPPDRDRFDMRMSGKLEGIGARLQKKNDYIKVIEVISGGPVWRGEHMEVGDLIMKVRQEDEEEAVSVVGMRVDDAVKLIKGPKGTKVTLTIKRVDGSIEEETITRDVVELAETYAKSTLIEKEEQKFGLVNLPAFYFDMSDYGERNAATDVKKEIESLKREGMDGLVLDLRGNGGGSLRTAVDIAGLFIKEGPVVQVASVGERKEVLSDDDDDVVWDGPLVILVNELSASASEILAAAMQDYKRGIIIGSEQSYGKGTVQNVIDLNRWLRKNDLGDMGALKLTTQKFYRVTGGSTQLEGVKSDVVMPDKYSYIDLGERDYDNPLPYDEISAAKFDQWDGYIDYEGTIKRSKERMEKSAQLQLIEDNARWVKQQRDRSVVSLNYQEYKAENARMQNETKKYEALKDYDNRLTYRSLPNEVALMKEDTTLRDKRKRWHKNLARDIYIEEAVNVLQDLKMNNIRRGKLADIKN